MSARDDIGSIRSRVKGWRDDVSRGLITASTDQGQHRLIGSLDGCWQEINNVSFALYPELMDDDEEGDSDGSNE